MRYLCSAFLLLFAFITTAQRLPRIMAQPNGHFLQTATGKPFFWLGDTNWELVHRLSRQEIDQFLAVRKQQRFTVLQVVALAEFDGLTQPNAHGDLPLLNLDPTQPALTPGNNPADSAQYDYWDHVDYLIKQAEKMGLYVALLPTWGDKLTKDWGAGPVIFTEKNARIYGQFLGKRYARATNVIWMLGGDRPATLTPAEATRRKREPYDHRPIWRAMAAGIHDGLGRNVPALMTYHTWGGGYRTSQEMADEPWLTMNTMQSGHGGGHDIPVWDWVMADFAKKPVKPTIDLEPNYDDHPVNPWPKWDPKNGYFTAYDVRKQTWRSVLAGGAGVTYGHHFVWQFYSAKRPAINPGDTLIPWQQALRSEAAGQMQHLRNLIEKYPGNRLPDNSLITSEIGEKGKHLQACRTENGRYAFIYTPVSESFTVDLSKLSGQRITAYWHDPRTGQKTPAGTIQDRQAHEFQPPANGPDWVLVLEGR
ncbi:glycoside hydrolase family 140 protein [Fibrella aquatilis]|uniref:Glycoside hydrolase family 140 protein n=1 Tax=Fibrella aquatilis TaxID=2817059 RepID=A0A939G9J5_9BACT|nr:glycoside hydrolase family 140 protein [Fibrella aquatilis]MBO0933149.1 glycoside hydrolase family 140 protein [Fibrella aquatilis]